VRPRKQPRSTTQRTSSGGTQGAASGLQQSRVSSAHDRSIGPQPWAVPTISSSTNTWLPAVMLNGVAETSSRARLNKYLERRRLTSDRRVGRYARSKALRRQEQLIRRGWPYLLAVVLLPDLLLPAAWLLRPAYRGLVIGLIVPVGPWLAAGVVVIFSGSASLWMGRLGEVWTADELRRARRSGWDFVNDVFLTSQIDHIAIGPAGVLVIDTKWSADPWPLDDASDSRRRNAVAGVKDQASHVRSLMRNRHSDAPVMPVVIQWGPPGSTEIGTWHLEDEVSLVTGSSFRSWLKSLPAANFDPEAAREGWEAVVGHIGGRERYVEAKEGPAPRTIGQLYWLVAKPILIVFVALYAAASLARLFKGIDTLVAIAAVASLGFLASASPRLRKKGLLWGSAVLVAYAVAILIVIVRHAS